MRVDNRVTHVPPPELVNTRTMKPLVAVQRVMDATVPEENSHKIPTVPGRQLEDLLRGVTVPAAPALVAAPLVMVMLVVEAAVAGAPHTGLVGEPVEKATEVAEVTQTATSPVSHAAATMPTAESKKYSARSPLQQATTTVSLPSPLDFAISSSQRNSNLWGSQRNVGGNNNTTCLYFPFYLDQAPLTWLESLDKNSIDEWDHLKDQFTSNFVGTMGRSGTRMDLEMVKQE
jgi:hypothetical protein